MEERESEREKEEMKVYEGKERSEKRRGGGEGRKKARSEAAESAVHSPDLET